MNPWLAHYGGIVGQNFSPAGSNYIASRRAFALAQLPAAVPFAVTSNNGEGFSVNTNLVTLAGSGWLDLRGIEVNGIPLAITWTSVTNWTLLVPLAPGTNFLTVQGVNHAGARPAPLRDSISITNTLPAELRPVVINEWMADNAGPGGFMDPADGLFQDWFELFNPNPTPVDLGGYHLTDDLAQPAKFTIPTNTIIAAGGFLLVWADENGSQNTPTNTDLHANFRLGNGGEAIGLFASDGISPLHTVTFGAQFLNVSQGLFPDGTVGTSFFMTNWTPRAANRLGLPATPRILSFALEGGQLRLAIEVVTGRSYRVETTADLGAPVWVPLGPAHPALAATLVIELTPGPEPQRFLRVRRE
jgi:hypothetical protein